MLLFIISGNPFSALIDFLHSYTYLCNIIMNLFKINDYFLYKLVVFGFAISLKGKNLKTKGISPLCIKDTSKH